MKILDPVDIDFDRYSREIEVAEDEAERRLLQEAEDAALDEPIAEELGG